jgi:hypothetical protein
VATQSFLFLQYLPLLVALLSLVLLAFLLAVSVEQFLPALLLQGCLHSVLNPNL